MAPGRLWFLVEFGKPVTSCTEVICFLMKHGAQLVIVTGVLRSYV